MTDDKKEFTNLAAIILSEFEDYGNKNGGSMNIKEVLITLASLAGHFIAGVPEAHRATIRQRFDETVEAATEGHLADGKAAVVTVINTGTVQ